MRALAVSEDEWDERTGKIVWRKQIVTIKPRGKEAIAAALEAVARQIRDGHVVDVSIHYRKNDECRMVTVFEDHVDLELVGLPADSVVNETEFDDDQDTDVDGVPVPIGEA